MLVSPAEHHDIFRLLGPYSSEVEKYGADFLWTCKAGVVGVQRKTCQDLVSSLRGDRVQRELVQQESLDQAVWLIEGDWLWDRNGSRKIRSHRIRDFTLAEYQGFALSVQHLGHWLVTTQNVEQTAEWLVQAERWFNKGEHDSLLRKPKAKVPKGLHILQHFDGVSLGRAKAIYNHFGRVPLKWDCTQEEMAQVSGIGQTTVRKLWEALR